MRKNSFCYLILTLLLCLIGIRTGTSQDNSQNSYADESAYYLHMAEESFINENTDSTKLVFREFFQKVARHPRRYPADLWVDNCYSLAKKIYSKDLELLSEVLNPLLEISPVINEDRVYGELGKLINIIGLTYKNQGFLEESIPIYFKALEYLKSCQSLEPRTMPGFYLNFGNAFRRLGDLNQADTYYNEALRQINLQLDDPEANPDLNGYFSLQKGNTLNSIGLNYHDLGEYEKALEVFAECLKLDEYQALQEKSRLYNNMALSYVELDEAEKAISHYTSCLNASDSLDYFDDKWVLYRLNFSDLLIEENNLDVADSLINNVLEISRDLPGIPLTYIATAYTLKGNILGKTNNYLSGISHIDLALSLLGGIDNDKFNYHTLPPINLDNSPFKVIQAMKIRARILNDWGNFKKDTSKMMMALENYELAETCVDSLRVIIESDESKINLSRQEKDIYSDKMDLLWQLYSASKSIDLAGKAFTTIEKGKAAGVWNIIQLSASREKSLPTAIIKKEQELKDQITDYENQLLDSALLALSNEHSIDSIRDKKFLLERELDSLNNHININFPDYNRRKFENRIYSLDEIRNILKPDQVLMQYFFSDEYLHQILVSKDSILYYTTPDPDTLSEKIEAFYQELQLTKYDYRKEDVNNYHELASGIYQALIPSTEFSFIDKELIILPDANLSYIPFETLVINDSLSPGSDFRHFQYLLYQNPISYSYTASMWAFRNQEKKPTKRAIFGIAPSYGFSNSDTISQWRNWESQLPKLPGTLEEVDLLKKKYRAKTYSNKKATEEIFKSEASMYKILHLAMHSISDEKNQANTCLAFTPFADKSENGRLYANEVRNMKLNASLTILSACKSGTGQLMVGEGVMSLSRMFILAGSSSVIMTLWSVDDQTSLKLIRNFYENLDEDMSVSRSLRSTKLEYLKDAGKLHSHPFFWSGFIHLGKDTEIKIVKSKTVYLWYGGLALLLSLLVIMIYIKAKTRP